MNEYRKDFIDYPTAWAICRNEAIAHDARCSYQTENGAFLCDCGAAIEWWDNYAEGNQ